MTKDRDLKTAVRSGMATIRFGIQLPGHATVEIARLAAPPSAVEIHDALDRPDGYPAISQAVVSGDRVVIAASAAVPFLTELVAGVAGYLVAAGIERGDITVCVAAHCVIDETSFRLHVGDSPVVADERGHIRLTRCQKMSAVDELTADVFGYLAADDDANPIYVRRELLDADFIIPIVACGDSFERQIAAVGGIVPYFVDAATRRRWDLRHLPDASGAAGEMIEEVPWLLGLQAAVLTHGDAAGDQNLSVMSIDRIGQLEVDSLPRSDDNQRVDTVPVPVDLVITEATVGPHRPTWEGVAVTLRRAAQRLPRRGRILLICDELPLQATGGDVIDNARGYSEVVEALKDRDADDSLALAGIAAVGEQHSVFVYRAKPHADDPAWWEYVESVTGCEQLMRTSQNPLVLANAHPE